MSKILKELCSDENELKKFQVLESYFADLDVSDIDILSDTEDLIQDVEPPHRLRMRVFTKKYLEPRRQAKFVGSRKVAEELHEEGRFFYVQGGALISNAFATVDSERLTIVRFHESLLEDPGQIKYIDMSMNDLLSTDLRLVADMVTDLSEKNMMGTNGLIMNLSGNRIHGAEILKSANDQALHTIISFVKFVDLRANPFVSVDRRDFFESFRPDSAACSKLIWVHEFHLNTHGWRRFVPENVIDNVIEIHKEYYAWMKENEKA